MGRQRSSIPKPAPSRLTGILLVVLATLCWGTTGVFIFNITRNSSLSAVNIAFWRDLISTGILLIGILIIKPRLLKVRSRDLPWLIAMGVVSVGLFHIFWNQAVLKLGASLATVLQSNTPVIVTILAVILFKDSLTSKKVLAILAAVGGTILAAGVIGRDAGSIDPAGIRLALLSSLTYGSFSLFGKKLTADYSPWTIIFYIYVFGTLTIYSVMGMNPDPWPTGSGIHFWMLGFVFVSTILGFGFFTWSLKILPASVAAITATAEVLFAAIWSNIFLGEQLGIWQILGALLIVFGVVMVSLKGSK